MVELVDIPFMEVVVSSTFIEEAIGIPLVVIVNKRVGLVAFRWEVVGKLVSCNHHQLSLVVAFVQLAE